MPTTSDQRPATSDQRPATSDQRFSQPDIKPRLSLPVHHIPRLACAASLALLAASHAHAQNVLVLVAGAEADIEGNVIREFTINGTPPTLIRNLQTPGSLPDDTFDTQYYDMVVSVQFRGYPNAAANQAILNDAIRNRKVGGAVYMIDNGGVPDSITAQMQQTLLESAGINMTPSAAQGRDENFVLNTNSPYSADFAAMNPLRGGWFFYMNGIPADNALYLAAGSTLPATGTTPVNNVYAAFVPASQSFGGQGACIVAISDSSAFETRNYRDRDYRPGYGHGHLNNPPVYTQNKFFPAVWQALSAGGACGLPASISKAFDKTTVARGEVSTLTITISNETGAQAIDGLVVRDDLPAPLEIAGAASHTCTGGTLTAAEGSNQVLLEGAELPAAGCTITVPVLWPLADTAVCVPTGAQEATNLIAPGANVAGKQNGAFTTASGHTSDRAQATLQCDPTLPPPPPPPPAAPASPVSVPTLGAGMLGLLSTLLAAWGGLGLLRRRKG